MKLSGMFNDEDGNNIQFEFEGGFPEIEALPESVKKIKAALLYLTKNQK